MSGIFSDDLVPGVASFDRLLGRLDPGWGSRLNRRMLDRDWLQPDMSPERSMPDRVSRSGFSAIFQNQSELISNESYSSFRNRVFGLERRERIDRYSFDTSSSTIDPFRGLDRTSDSDAVNGPQASPIAERQESTPAVGPLQPQQHSVGSTSVEPVEFEPFALSGNVDKIYFSSKSATSFGDINVADEDVVQFDGLSFRIAIDGSDVGLAGVKIDGLAVLGPTSLLMSF